MITAGQLNDLLGDAIADICPNGYTNPHDNHCAHFVSHVMGFRFGATCRMMSNGKQPGANIRVQELFANCPEVGAWTGKPVGVTTGLVFVTDASNVDVAKKHMDNVPKKHAGIFINGTIWHYSNSKSQVVSMPPEQFIHHYPGAGIALFYGTFPPSA